MSKNYSSTSSNKMMQICKNSIYKKFCNELIDLENINQILITVNDFKGKNIDMSIEDEDLNLFINKINPSDNQKYRLIAKFNNNTFATIRFGE